MYSNANPRVGAIDDAPARVVDRLGGLAEDDVRPREPDAEARVGRALDEQAAALRPVAANDLLTEPLTRLLPAVGPFMIETVLPSIVLPTPSWRRPRPRRGCPRR